MPSSTCQGCRTILRVRLRRRIADLQCLRRPYHASAARLVLNPSGAGIRSFYWDTIPPTEEQLTAASAFFSTHPPRKLWTATEWRKQAAQSESNDVLTPEVAFLGRSNVGKSSLLNAILNSPGLNHVGAKPGKTSTMHAWGLSATDPITGGALRGAGGQMDTKVAVLDMPGYGHASHDDWGDEIITYLRRRKQLRRVFILLDSVHGVKKADEKMLRLLRTEAIPHQIIASKCDRINGGKLADRSVANSLIELRQSLEMGDASDSRIMTLGEIIAVGALGDGRKNDKVKSHSMKGVQDVQWAILRATGLDEFALKKMAEKTTPDSPYRRLFAKGLPRHSVQNENDRVFDPISMIPPGQPADGLLEWDEWERLLPPAPSRPLDTSVKAATPSPSRRSSSTPPLSARTQRHAHLNTAEPFTSIAEETYSPGSIPPPTKTSSNPDGKWVPNVGGMAELLEMSQPKGGKKGGHGAQQAAATGPGSRNAKRASFMRNGKREAPEGKRERPKRTFQAKRAL